jgi:steroid-24-oyl-CoA synthetase
MSPGRTDPASALATKLRRSAVHEMPRQSIRSYPEVLAELTGPGAKFEMRDVDILGRRTRVWARAPQSLRQVVAQSRDARGTFLIAGEQRWTFDDHYRAVCALADHFVNSVDIRPGDRIAIAMRNQPEWSVAFWATVAIGAVAVPLNAWWTSRELSFALVDCGAVAAVVDAERMLRIIPVRPGRLRCLLVSNSGTDTMDETLPAWVEPLERVLFARFDHDDPRLPPATVAAGDIATIFYTSGTTGLPKGVVGTHRNMCTSLLSRAFFRACHAARLGVTVGPPHPVTLLTVPLFHVTGCHSYLLPALASASTLVLMHRWDPEQALRLISAERVTGFGGVPSTVLQMMDAYQSDQHDLSSLTSVTVGGAAAPPALFRRLQEELPWVIPGNGYGMTETSTVAIYNLGVDCQNRPESIGRLVPVMDARVVDSAGENAARGSPGELWLRGPNVAAGYWGHSEETSAAGPADGWLRTGDIAVVDDEGFFTLVGRAKELIIRGGENISPAEIEAVLFTHPAVSDAAAFGVAHPDLGEEVAAVVCVKRVVTQEELRDHVGTRLAHFKVPAHLQIVPGPLPRNSQGKLLRQRLQADFSATV